MSDIRAFAYAGYTATNLEAWQKFGQEVLGLQLGETEADGSLVFRLDSYKRRLVIHPGDSDDIAYAGWEVSGATQLNAVREQLRARGVVFEEGSSEQAKARDVVEMILFNDPEGLALEVFYGATELNHKPFHSPLGRPDFITGQQGMGHLVLGTERYHDMVAFYRDVMNFKISDYCGVHIPGLPFDGHMTFFHVNPRHHSLALGNFSVGRRCNHLMFEVESATEVGLAFDRAKAAGAHILSDLGQHTNDKVFSFYVVTPSGWSVEIGWGGVSIDDEIWHVTHHPTPSIWGHNFAMPPRPAIA